MASEREGVNEGTDSQARVGYQARILYPQNSPEGNLGPLHRGALNILNWERAGTRASLNPRSRDIYFNIYLRNIHIALTLCCDEFK